MKQGISMAVIQYKNFAYLKGPAGERGVKGDQGPRGLSGDTGPVGLTGSAGDASTVAGPKGDTGAKGDTGDTGAKGDTGDDGADALWNWQSEYSAGPQYQEGDIVAYQGSTYRRNNYSNSAMGFIPTNATYWELVSEKGDTGAPGPGVPAGGTAGQVLAKINGTDYSTEWVEQTGGGTGASNWGDIDFNGGDFDNVESNDYDNSEFILSSTLIDYPTIVVAPATTNSLGETGQIAYDNDYVYICIATNTWKRSELSSW